MDSLIDKSQSGSAYSITESPNGSSSESPRASTNSSRREFKRRKTTDVPIALQLRKKRVKFAYNDRYRKIFNQTIEELVPKDDTEYEMLPGSQIGVALWSSKEKALFFNSLERMGPCDLKGIASAIGSKSESEVYLYLELLQKVSVDQQVSEPVRKLFKPHKMKAAVEISEDCCAALDRAAGSLAVLQYNEEIRVENSKHPDFPILDLKIARWVDRRLRNGEEGENEVSKVIPSAALLNLKTFLVVSKRFFMNSSIPENNWRSHAEKRQSPMLTYTAFSDFRTLAISFTRRLIQSCLFFTLSRLRAISTPGYYVPRRHVKRQDIVAALNVLGLEFNGRAVWAGTARKCKLQIYEDVRRRRATGHRYSYDEVEKLLSSSNIERRGRSRAPSLDFSDGSVLLEPEQETNETNPETNPSANNSICSDPPSTEEEYSSDSSDGNNLPKSPTDRAYEHTCNEERQEQAQDTYMEARDQQASKKEEQCLWEMLGEDPAKRMNVEDIAFPKAPYSQRKKREDLADWRVWVDYAAEWELNRSPPPDADFVGNRNLGSERSLAAGLTDSDFAEDCSDKEQSAGEEPSSNESLQGKPSSRAHSLRMDLDTDSDENDDALLNVRCEEGHGPEVYEEAEDSDTHASRPRALRPTLSTRKKSSDQVQNNRSEGRGQRTRGLDDSAVRSIEGGSTTDISTDD